MRYSVRSTQNLRGSTFSTPAMGSWLSDMVSNINWNPMDSPVTQAVVTGTQQLVSGVTQAAVTTAKALTAPAAQLANAVGINLDPTLSPIFGTVKPVLDTAGVVLGVGPLGQYLQMGGSIAQSNVSKPATAPVRTGGGVQYVTLPGQAAPQAGAAVAGAGTPADVARAFMGLPAGTPAATVAQLASHGFKTGAWPAYRRYAGR